MSNELEKVRNLLKAHGKPPREVYFDLENSGFVPKEVVEEMLPYFNKYGYGHPSITNKPGWEALEAVLEAQEYIAKTLNASPNEIVFVHSGTEANNLAILGSILANKNKGKKIIISAIEHYSVLIPVNELGKQGFNVLQIPVDEEGFIDLDILDSLVDKETVLVSIQTVNHEIGTIQPLKEAIEIIRDHNPDAIIHTDAVDAYARIPIDVKKLDVDLLSISSHKILGPKGAAALYVREGVKLDRIIHGALSTQSYWPGVENVPAIVGFRKAAQLAFTDFEEKIRYVRELRDKLLNGIMDGVPNVLLNGPRGDKRAPDNVNISFLYVEGEALTVELSLRGIYVSSGSACTSRVLEPSHVLLAIGRKHEEAHGSILFKISRYHSIDDIDYVLKQIPEAVERLRILSSIKPA
ncbi:cysteine desulfurase [Desulfurococcaceae archaeon MEX13E-LK6-19]|nr:cysteine desulfurase [Desulfurococcaceae archaeon MEX13E-LK6-19]